MKRITGVLAVAILTVAITAMVGLWVAGCGGSDQEQAKADLGVALTDFETAVDVLRGMDATSTVAEFKTAYDGLAVHFTKVVEAANKVSGADVASFEAAWAELEAAVAKVPDDSSIVTAALLVVPKIQPVVDAEKALKELIEPESR